jgi:hypothetical protein
MGLACLAFTGIMVIWRPAFNDFTVWLLLWLACPGTMCIAGLVLWAYRKQDVDEPGVRAQRIQCWVAIALATVAAAVVYLLVVRAQRVPAGLPQ